MVDIAIELTKQGQLKESLAIVEDINDEKLKSEVIKDIAVELSKQGQLGESLAIVDGISDESYKNSALKDIAVELVKSRKMNESFSIARGINDVLLKSRALKAIAVELSSQEQWFLAEKTGQEIPVIAVRNSCWIDIAFESVKGFGWEKGFKKRAFLHSYEAQLFYLKGWTASINLLDVNNYCLHESIPMLADDGETIEMLLHKYATREVAFGNPSRKLVDRLNRTLNIQWVIDIKNKI
jgi:hypothetical protein